MAGEAKLALEAIEELEATVVCKEGASLARGVKVVVAAQGQLRLSIVAGRKSDTRGRNSPGSAAQALPPHP